MADGWRIYMEGADGKTPGLTCYEVPDLIAALSGYASALSLLPPIEVTSIVIVPVPNVEKIELVEDEDAAAA